MKEHASFLSLLNNSKMSRDSGDRRNKRKYKYKEKKKHPYKKGGKHRSDNLNKK